MEQRRGLSVAKPGSDAIGWPSAAVQRQFVARVARRQPLGVAGGIIVLLLVLMAIFAEQLAPYDPKDAVFEIYHAPNWAFIMGTDHLGRDIFSRVVWGARLSLYVGLVSVSVALARERCGALSPATSAALPIASANASSIP